MARAKQVREQVLRALEAALQARPHLRLGQVLAIAAGPRLGEITDEALAEALAELARTSKPPPSKPD